MVVSHIKDLYPFTTALHCIMKLKQLGPYRIVKRIGKGGMGAVYEAVAENASGGASKLDASKLNAGKLNAGKLGAGKLGAGKRGAGKRVAIKALSPQLAMAEGFRERFEAEIESLKKLKHPGIVRLYGYGEQDGVLFYSMELVEGSSLEEELNNGRRFDWRETLQIGIQICRALKHAHDHGVVHRDIKPANLMLTADQQVKIADFGIARLFGGTQLTTAGGVLGTADYMSPEQADGIAVTERCDQYSLGGVMYALLSGRPPFKAKTMPEMLQLQRFADPEPVCRYAVDTPDQLDRLITQLLSKDPQERFPNVLVLARHMEAMEKALSRPVQEESPNDESTADFPSARPASTSANVDQATRAEDAPLILPNETTEGTDAQSIYDAPTLDQESQYDAPAQHVRKQLVDTDLSEPEVPAKQDHFITVDEEARQRREQAESQRAGSFAQLAVLIGTLGFLVWGGWQLMKPLGADQLYAKIKGSLNAANGVEELDRDTAKETSQDVAAFLKRFPEDSRSKELESISEQFDFLAQERNALARSRYNNNAKQLPLEELYFLALSNLQNDPENALSNLQALLVLYDPSGEIDTFEAAKAASEDFKQLGDPRLLVVAQQRIERLTETVEQIRSIHLPALRNRLQAAKRLQLSNPVRARQMHLAVIELYGNRPWAREIVRQVRQQLARQQLAPQD